ncbi:hypothetical protein CU098_011842 [Rhizopus stolonifer]|uniref:CNNM transmembrane domain-containing protein n=1 Tax=Rhizopus stolonifer TaxID=4846 RepID=A0A367KLN1_RHIST|nr:hypothetical protein CU098_011842 [Rhizopus stolonifer]
MTIQGVMSSPLVHIDTDVSLTLLRFIFAAFLVLLGGFFAGLTLGLMGLDETLLQVMVETGTELEKKYALKVLSLLDKGKYWVLVTLLLSNVIVNETLPIVLDSLAGGGGVWAVLLSTALVVIFGEVLPQSICVRYGLAIGAKCSKIVLVIMYLLYPIAYPTSLILNRFLGTTRGTTYKKAGLKCLVSMHQSDDMEGLTLDEVNIISSVLDLKDKRVCDVMIPMSDVFTLSIDTVLDDSLIHKNGYSRIPIRESNNKSHYIGMLLVKNLVNHNHSNQLKVSQLPLSPLPETYPTTSCLDILNFFQEGKSHMALITKSTGETPLGVITLEDVIESLIGEEIVDETDVFIDANKASGSPKESTDIRVKMNSYSVMVKSTPSFHANSGQQSDSFYYHARELKS